MWVGEACMLLYLTPSSEKLLFAVYLRKDEPYRIRTDFSQGQMSILDFGLMVLKSCNKTSHSERYFEPSRDTRHVIPIGITVGTCL
jgi:hypothetical protein